MEEIDIRIDGESVCSKIEREDLSELICGILMYLKQLKSLVQDVDAAEIRVQVCVYAFDLLYLNGEVSPSANVETLTLQSTLCVHSL